MNIPSNGKAMITQIEICADNLAKSLATAIKMRYLKYDEIGFVYDLIKDYAYYHFMKSYYEEGTKS